MTNTRDSRTWLLVVSIFIVAADRLTRADAEFLRKEIAHHWAECTALLDVATSLARRREGAYYAEETTEGTT